MRAWRVMHVLFVNARYSPEGIAGPAFTTQFLAEQLVRENDRATVVCRTERTGIVENEVNGVRVLRVGLDVSAPSLLKSLATVLDADRPDVIHTLFPKGFPLDELAAMGKGRRIPIVHTLLAFFLLCPYGSLMRAGQRCQTQCPDCRAATRANRRFAAQIDAVAGISRFMLDLHCHWGLFQDTPIQRVIHDGYQAPALASAPQDVDVPLRLGYLGRLDPLKGIDLLLHTLTTELGERAWTLALGGRGDPAHEKALRTRYGDSRICFLGFVEPTELLSRIDVLIVPSLWEEPFPRVLIEAYAHGVAVVGSKRGGIPEGIEPGRTGLVFDPDDQGGLARAIAMLLEDPRLVTDMKANARAIAATAYTPARILGQYRSIYDAVSSNTPGP
jgi:glycosyltransferase involved in cell wall biosynthesis